VARGEAGGCRLPRLGGAAQDLKALAAGAREHAIECDGPKTEPWGSLTLTVADPDGFKLTLTPPQEG
jgi:hypothetical protein